MKNGEKHLTVYRQKRALHALNKQNACVAGGIARYLHVHLH